MKLGIRKWLKNISRAAAGNDKFHFVGDYEALVKELVNQYPLDEAMSRAVGGEYERFGRIQTDLLLSRGLSDGMRLVDLGCGSGRLASVLHANTQISYVGIDVIQQLLDYAKSKAPSYQFIRHRELSIPQSDASADMVCAFSLFTHLLHAETYLYLEECRRILKPGGKVVFSFLEFAEPYHWHVFEATKAATRADKLPHLNTFIERNAIVVWAEKLGFGVDEFISAADPIGNNQGLGQSAVVLSKSA